MNTEINDNEDHVFPSLSQEQFDRAQLLIAAAMNTKTPLEKATLKAERRLRNASGRLRVHVAQAARSLIGVNGKYIPLEEGKGQAAARAELEGLSRILRLTRSLFEEINLLALKGQWSSLSIGEVLKDIIESLSCAADPDVLRGVDPQTVLDACSAFSASDDVLVSTKSALLLIKQLEGVEKDINSLGFSLQDFNKLAGADRAVAPPNSVDAP